LIFRKKKYYFNPVTLTYEEIKNKKSHQIMALGGFILIAGIFAFASGYLLNMQLGSAKSRELEKELSIRNQELLGIANKGTEIAQKLRTDVFERDNTYRMILQMDTIPVSLRSAGTGGSAAANEMARQKDITYQVQSILYSLNNQIQIQSGSLQQLYYKAMEYSEGQTHLPAIQPVSKQDLTMIGSDFGERSDPFFMTPRLHYGLDFVAPAGKNVYATGNGIVTFVGHSRTGYGNEIVIDHKFGFGSRYAHLQMIKVKEGEQIKRGQIIGTVGSTGRATGPHLHYEVLYQNQPVNPSFYFDTSLTTEEFAQIINKAGKADNLRY
jgi:murein DD-endopeptidase MepM/ murein hydrolase activator NlpD